jgi:hypothetical protein
MLINTRHDCQDLPIFKYISRYFDCSHNQLTSLKGCPAYVGGGFYCYFNKLTSLDGCPIYVGGSFYCCYNKVKLERPNTTIIEEFING